MREYEPKYDKSIREKNKQRKMKRIDRMLRCPKQTKISDYSLDFKLYGEIDCDLCPRMTRVLNIHDEELTKEVPRFPPLPRLDVDGKKFIPIEDCHNLMDNGSPLADELKDLEKLRGDFKDNGDELEERGKRYGKLGKQINW